jgi:hypothetical protein
VSAVTSKHVCVYGEEIENSGKKQLLTHCPLPCRYSNLPFMPPTPLPEGCNWPYGTGPYQGLVPALMAYMALINSRYKYRQHNVHIIVYGITPNVSQCIVWVYLKDSKHGAVYIPAAIDNTPLHPSLRTVCDDVHAVAPEPCIS